MNPLLCNVTNKYFMIIEHIDIKLWLISMKKDISSRELLFKLCMLWNTIKVGSTAQCWIKRSFCANVSKYSKSTTEIVEYISWMPFCKSNRMIAETLCELSRTLLNNCFVRITAVPYFNAIAHKHMCVCWCMYRSATVHCIRCITLELYEVHAAI